MLWDDTRLVLTSPARWDKQDWLRFAGASALVVGSGLLLDPAVERSVKDHNQQSVSDALKKIEPFGEEYSLATLAAFYAGGLLAHDPTAVQVGEDGAAASIVAGVLVSPAIKLITGRERPRNDNGHYSFHPFSGKSSFPSGHATEAFAVASVVSEHYDQVWVKALSYGIASLVGAARIDHAAHHVSDVVAGALIGASIGKAVVHINERERSSIAFEPMVGDDYVGIAATMSF